MTKFKINSQFYSNICLVLDKEITNHMCRLHINEYEAFEIPLLRLISASSVLTQKFLSDLTLNDFYIKVPFNNKISKNLIQKIQNALNLEEVQLENEDEIINFSLFGKTINNEQFLEPISQILNTEISKENVIKILETKYSCGYQYSGDDQEIQFISANFSSLKEDLLKLALDTTFKPLIELILQNNQLKLQDEDELLTFILDLCNTNNDYEYLFEYVWLEYCSVNKIKELLEYANKNIFTTQSSIALSKCFSRRLIQEKLPVEISHNKNESRYVQKSQFVEYNDDDPLNGMLRKENENENVLLEASSRQEFVYTILKALPYIYFYTNDEQNSWIKASFKNKKLFIISKYMIRGQNRPYSGGWCHLQTWKLEGQLPHGNWILLDTQSNQDISESKIKLYKINYNEPICAVRLTQTGKSTSNNDNLLINQFEIFGKVIQ